MNRSQQIALAVGIAWAVLTAARPPVAIPASSVTGAEHSTVVLSFWNSPLVRDYGISAGYFAAELVAIAALTAGLVYFLKTPPARRRA